MFCHECGSELSDVARFCPRCGAKVLYEDMVQRPSTDGAMDENILKKSIMEKDEILTAIDPAQVSAPEKVLKKKTLKKLPIILGAVVLTAIVIIFIMLNWEGKIDYIASVKAHTPFAISQGLPYTNEEVLNKYIISPEWKTREGEDAYYVDISGMVKGTDSKVMVTFKVSQDANNPDIALMEPESVIFDDIQTTTQDEAVEFLYLLFCVYEEGYEDLTSMQDGDVNLPETYMNEEDIAVPLDELNQEMNPLNTEYAEEALDDIPFGYEGDGPGYREAYSSKVIELSESDDSLQFALIDLIGNGVPELVADNPGYYISVFTWDGEVVTLMDQWGYGVGGNNGYEYLPGQNVIRNYNMDYAGAVIYEDYMTVNDAYEINPINEGFSIWYFKDMNGNGQLDEDEYSEEPIYYYGDTEISEEDYVKSQITGDYEWIKGSMLADTMLDFIWAEEYEEEAALSDFSYDSLQLYGGSYEGSNGDSLYVSIYSSFDEGNILGNVALYDSVGYEAFAYIRDEGEGDGIYALYYGDSIRMNLRFYQDHDGKYCADIQGLDKIYSNSNQVETYIMTEQYIP